ncbi:MAG: hypothetical protein B7Z26_12010 [Asticcacaulis sp. 32-58-5]|nr:MAG: hypothetical protein B7Z26_12010 [Asticcacaulis sp. 32-58-5]
MARTVAPTSEGDGFAAGLFQRRDIGRAERAEFSRAVRKGGDGTGDLGFEDLRLRGDLRGDLKVFSGEGAGQRLVDGALCGHARLTGGHERHHAGGILLLKTGQLPLGRPALPRHRADPADTGHQKEGGQNEDLEAERPVGKAHRKATSVLRRLLDGLAWQSSSTKQVVAKRPSASLAR